MEKDLSCLLLLLVLLALTPGGAPSPTSAQDCNAAGTVVKEGTPQVIGKTPITWSTDRYVGSLTLFVKPESDFEGVTLYATTNGATLHTAWFPAEDKCFPRDGKWLEFRAMIWTITKGLEFCFTSGACWEQCYINTDQTRPTEVIVVAHGPSRWLTKPPHEHCGINLLYDMTRNPTRRCMDSPPIPTTSTTTITPSTTKRATSTTSKTPSTPKMTEEYTITIAVSAAAAVAVVVVVVVVVFYWKRKAVTSPRQAGLSPPPDEHVIENDIYESFDGVANHAAPQTFHNDRYDSRSAHGHRHDS